MARGFQSDRTRTEIRPGDPAQPAAHQPNAHFLFLLSSYVIFFFLSSSILSPSFSLFCSSLFASFLPSSLFTVLAHTIWHSLYLPVSKPPPRALPLFIISRFRFILRGRGEGRPEKLRGRGRQDVEKCIGYACTESRGRIYTRNGESAIEPAGGRQEAVDNPRTSVNFYDYALQNWIVKMPGINRLVQRRCVAL